LRGETVQDHPNGKLITSIDTQITQSRLEVVVEVGENHQSNRHSGVYLLHVGIASVHREVLVAAQSATEESNQVTSEPVESGGVGEEVGGTWRLLAIEERKNGTIFEFLGNDGGDNVGHELNLVQTQSGSIFSANGSGIYDLASETLEEDSDHALVLASDTEGSESPDEDRVESIENISTDGHLHVNLLHVGVTSVFREAGIVASQSSSEIRDEISSEAVELVGVVQKIDRAWRKCAVEEGLDHCITYFGGNNGLHHSGH